MKPKTKQITITDNRAKILQLLNDLVLQPRLKALEWAGITKQTPNMKIGYPGQHLASLVTGMVGTRTGARGHDLVDGSETKSCSRVDQLDKCNACGAKIMRFETSCPDCDSTNIKRNDDSKWLFTIRSANDLKVLTEKVPRVVLALADYPRFEHQDFETIAFSIYEIWPQEARHSSFAALMKGYYTSIYQVHKQMDAAKTPAPKNFWPKSYQFYKCNPVLTFVATVKNANTAPVISIDHFVEPTTDRSTLIPVPMPSSLLTIEELLYAIKMASKAELKRCLAAGVTVEQVLELSAADRPKKKQLSKLFEMLPALSEALRAPLSLRDTDRPVSFVKQYERR